MSLVTNKWEVLENKFVTRSDKAGECYLSFCRTKNNIVPIQSPVTVWNRLQARFLDLTLVLLLTACDFGQVLSTYLRSHFTICNKPTNQPTSSWTRPVVLISIGLTQELMRNPSSQSTASESLGWEPENPPG